jgi:large subunit ribosomal protein L3
VTVLSLDGCQVVGVRTEDERTVTTKKGGEVTRTDGYKAVIMGVGDKKAKRTNKALRGQFAKAGVAPKAQAERIPRLWRPAGNWR